MTRRGLFKLGSLWLLIGQLGQQGVDIRFQLRLIKELELMEFLAAGGKALDPAQTQQLFEQQDMGVTPLNSFVF